ncbi:MAG: hypothetical protein R2831_09870 [Chitinophagaceae bacterium]
MRVTIRRKCASVPCQLQLWDSIERIVLEKKVRSKEIEINTSNLAKGLYKLKLIQANSTLMTQFFVH